jgi:hypothetical protein
MKNRAGLLILILSVLQVGCEREVVWLSKEKADWDYVEAAWGGAKAGPVEVSEETLKIPFVFHLHKSTRTDSGICIYDPTGEVHGKRIRLRLNQGVCSNRMRYPLVAEMPKPSPGEYEIVYDDFSARYPAVISH